MHFKALCKINIDIIYLIIYSGFCIFVSQSSQVRDGVWKASDTYLNKYCPPIGSCPEGSHVLCMYHHPKQKTAGPRCHMPIDIPMTVEIATFILNVSNIARTKIAKGEETGKNGERLYQAYGMNKLHWDNELATFAHIMTRQCILRHDLCRASKKFPEPSQCAGLVRFSYPDWKPVSKTAKMEGDHITPQKIIYAVTQIVSSWYQAKRYVTQNWVDNYPDWSSMQNNLPTQGKTYLEMVYYKATHMGCGIIGYADYAFHDNSADVVYNIIQMVCNFSSRPRVSEQVYIVEKPTGPGYTIRCGCPIGYEEDAECLCTPIRSGICKAEENKCNETSVVLLPIIHVEDAPARKLAERSSHKSRVESANNLTERRNTFEDPKEIRYDMLKLVPNDTDGPHYQLLPPNVYLQRVQNPSRKSLQPFNLLTTASKYEVSVTSPQQFGKLISVKGELPRIEVTILPIDENIHTFNLISKIENKINVRNEAKYLFENVTTFKNWDFKERKEITTEHYFNTSNDRNRNYKKDYFKTKAGYNYGQKLGIQSEQLSYTNPYYLSQNNEIVIGYNVEKNIPNIVSNLKNFNSEEKTTTNSNDESPYALRNKIYERDSNNDKTNKNNFKSLDFENFVNNRPYNALRKPTKNEYLGHKFNGQNYNTVFSRGVYDIRKRLHQPNKLKRNELVRNEVFNPYPEDTPYRSQHFDTMNLNNHFNLLNQQQDIYNEQIENEMRFKYENQHDFYYSTRKDIDRSDITYDHYWPKTGRLKKQYYSKENYNKLHFKDSKRAYGAKVLSAEIQKTKTLIDINNNNNEKNIQFHPFNRVIESYRPQKEDFNKITSMLSEALDKEQKNMLMDVLVYKSLNETMLKHHYKAFDKLGTFYNNLLEQTSNLNENDVQMIRNQILVGVQNLKNLANEHFSDKTKSLSFLSNIQNTEKDSEELKYKREKFSTNYPNILKSDQSSINKLGNFLHNVPSYSNQVWAKIYQELSEIRQGLLKTLSNKSDVGNIQEKEHLHDLNSLKMKYFDSIAKDNALDRIEQISLKQKVHDTITEMESFVIKTYEGE